MLEIPMGETTEGLYFSVKMHLIGWHQDILEGNNGYAKSTWIGSHYYNQNNLNIDANDGQWHNYFDRTTPKTGSSYQNQTFAKMYWDFDTLMNSPFDYSEDDLKNNNYLYQLPSYLLKAMSQVIKYTSRIEQGGSGREVNHPLVQKIWTPSVHEMFNDLTTYYEKGHIKPLYKSDWDQCFCTLGPYYEDAYDILATAFARTNKYFCFRDNFDNWNNVCSVNVSLTSYDFIKAGSHGTPFALGFCLG